MKKTELLMSLNWYDFSTYPLQNKKIYLHLIPKYFNAPEQDHRFVAISNFNAAVFCPQDVIQKLKLPSDYTFKWLPAEKVEEVCSKPQSATLPTETK